MSFGTTHTGAVIANTGTAVSVAQRSELGTDIRQWHL
jgi:hypothetical protein